MDYFAIIILLAGSLTTSATPRAYDKELFGCGLRQDTACFVNLAQDYIAEKRTEILAQADQEVLKATGRSDDGSSPSHLTNAISRIMAELTEMLKEGISGLFKSGRDDDKDPSGEAAQRAATDLSTSELSGTNQSNVGIVEGRKKKKSKKQKIASIIKLVLIGAALVAKLTILLKLFSAALQFKFFLVALGGLVLNAARLYFDLKKGHQPQKVIYYEHAQHQHHYEGGEEEWAGSSSGPGGNYWGRSYELQDEKDPQSLAYAQQKPQQAETGFSWLG